MNFWLIPVGHTTLWAQILVERNDVLHLICHFLEQVIKEISWTMFTKFFFHCYWSSFIITTGNAVLQLEGKIPRLMTITFSLCWERPAVIMGRKKDLLQVWIQQPSSLQQSRIHLVMWKCRMKMTPMAWFCRPRQPQQTSHKLLPGNFQLPCGQPDQWPIPSQLGFAASCNAISNADGFNEAILGWRM